MKLIQTKEYLLLIDEEAEIKVGDVVLSCINNEIIESFPNIALNKAKKDGNNKIIAYYPITPEAKELDLPLLPSPFEELDFKNIVEDLPEHDALNSMDGTYSSFHYQSEAMIKGYELCYKAAQSKQFSLEDLISNFKPAFDKFINDGGAIGSSEECIQWQNVVEWFPKFLQSLSTQQLPKEFVPEYEYVHDETVSFPKTKEGKATIKTITNSEGKQELIGKWIY